MMAEKTICTTTLENYWELFDQEKTPLDLVATKATSIFADDATWESERLPEPLVGRDSIVKHIIRIRGWKNDKGNTTSRSEILWSGNLEARWTWKVQSSSTLTTGTDVVQFASDGRIHSFRIIAGEGNTPDSIQNTSR